MPFPTKVAVEGIDKESDTPSKSDPVASGPPPASPKPRPAPNSSLFSSVGKSAQDSSQAGLGAEGSSPSMIGMQGAAMIQRGIQMLNLAFPENPGLVAVLADLTGRLQMIIPQLVAGASNQSAGSGLFPQQGMDPSQGGMQGGMPQPGMPPPGPPGMGGPPGMPPQGGPPMAGAPPMPGQPPMQ